MNNNTKWVDVNLYFEINYYIQKERVTLRFLFPTIFLASPCFEQEP